MVNENNIEQRIFEYHEGLMDAGQKNELMKYLHQYPEYQRDFAIWAQARLYDEGVAIPVFQQKLIKPTVWYTSAVLKWSVGIGTLAVVCLFIARLYTNNSPVEISPVKMFIKEQIGKSAIQDKPLIDIDKQITSILKKKQAMKKKKVKIVFSSAEKENKKLIKTPNQVIAETETEQSIAEKPIVQEEVISKEELSTDNYNNNSDEPIKKEPESIEEAEKPANAKKPKRFKQKMSLRPNSDILPTSPNF